MSLSQKHLGLILVPWFNSDEWRYVYQLVYSNNKEKQVEALNLLKIWKMRTPILPMGVEGTLILHDVLSVDSESMPDEQISNLYAVALMRFLNLSAANSERQGSFTKTSAKNELPKWLTNLRHDIAHGHQIPSKYNLKMGLDFGFQWLKDKYWEPQSKTITDYYIRNENTFDDTLINSLQIYIDINTNLFEKTEVDESFYENIRNLLIYKKYRKKNLHPHLLLEIFLLTITQSFEKGCGVENVRQCLDILVSATALLRPNIDILSEDEDGTVKINAKFVRIWINLINLFHHHGLLLYLVDRLFDVVGDIVQTNQSRKMASLWVNEIFQTLQKIREFDAKQEGESVLCLERNRYTYSEESLEFQCKVLYLSDENAAQYTKYFLDSLLQYNLNSDEFNLDALNLLNVNSVEAEDKIYTVNDIDNVEIEYVDFTELGKRNKTAAESYNKNNGKMIGGRNWKKIEDAEPFKTCPLGVLPQQIELRHPYLVLT